MTLTFVSKADTTTGANATATIAATKPAGVTAGDLLLAVVAAAGNATAPTIDTIPSGWTLVPSSTVSDTGTSTSITIAAYTRTAGSSEPATYTFGSSSVTGRLGVTVLDYRGSDGIPSGHVATAVQGTTSTSRVSGSVTVGAGEWLLSVFADSVLGQTWTAPSGDALRTTVSTSNTNFIVSDTNAVVTAGTYSKASTTGTSSNLAAMLILGLHTATVTNQPPTVSAGPDQTATAGSTVTLTGAATDSDGTIASRQWTAISYPGSAPTITNATTNTATFTAAAGVYVFQFAATDNSGATSTSRSTVYVPAAAATPIAATENSGAWTGSYTDLADVSDSTYVQSSGSGTNTYRLAPVTQNSSLVVTVRAAQTGTGASLTVTLLQGTTSIATWTLSGLTTTPTDYPLALTSTQVAAITNWNALDVRLS